MADVVPSEGGQLFETLQKARTTLRHAAHAYAGTKKKDKFFRDRAADDLENAAITMALAAAVYGVRSDCATPAGAAGRVWKEGLDPETALHEAGKIVDNALKRSQGKK
jgi:hypothetical protein